jgi:hypothetical protein
VRLQRALRVRRSNEIRVNVDARAQTLHDSNRGSPEPASAPNGPDEDNGLLSTDDNISNALLHHACLCGARDKSAVFSRTLQVYVVRRFSLFWGLIPNFLLTRPATDGTISPVLTRSEVLITLLKWGAVRVRAVVFAPIILAALCSFPAFANTSSCSSVTPVATGCTPVDSNFFNSSLNASVDTFSGTFTADDNIQVFEIDVTAQQVNLTMQSFAYGGGTDFTGNTVSIPTPSTFGPLGGFASVFSLYDSTGALLTSDFTFNGCGLSPVNPTTGACYDASLTATVGTGVYYLALTENNNFPNGGDLFSSGVIVDPTAFNEGSNPTFTSNFSGGVFCAAPFCDPEGNQMNGNYAVDIATQTVVPEPGSFALLSCGSFLALSLYRRRRRVSGI